VFAKARRGEAGLPGWTCSSFSAGVSCQRALPVPAEGTRELREWSALVGRCLHAEPTERDESIELRDRRAFLRLRVLGDALELAFHGPL
jgi:hypothetical protein